MAPDSPGPAPSPSDPEPRALTPLTVPEGGIPPLTDSTQSLRQVVARFAAGHGPVAVDAERASGYRYSQRAYLIQLKRAGSGIALIDPIACPDLHDLQAAIGGEEWILHAASQDLPCLEELGLRPARLFDTELAARLLGYPKVGLAAVVAEQLGLGLAKEHSAVDWSIRPLRESWLAYAALDVEVLIELRDILSRQLAEAGKLEWAEEEFEAERTAPAPAPRIDPWRRVSGIHAIRDRGRLAVVRELWEERNRNAQARDIAQGRVLPDDALVRAAEIAPRTVVELSAIRPFGRPFRRADLPGYLAAIDRGLSAPDSSRPPLKAPRGDGPPPPRIWRERNPAADERLKAARVAIAELSERLAIPVENLLSPAIVRAVCWDPPAPAAEAVRERLLSLGARPWQADHLTPILTDAIARA